MGDGQARAPVPIHLFCLRLHPSESSHCAWPSAGRKARKSFGPSGRFPGSWLQAHGPRATGTRWPLSAPDPSQESLGGGGREERGRAPR